MIAPTGGDVRMNGRSLTGLDPEVIVRTGIAHVPEGRRLFAGLTVRENLRVGAYASGGGPGIDPAGGLFPPPRGGGAPGAGGALGGGGAKWGGAPGAVGGPQGGLVYEVSPRGP